jgi:exopolysaccharide biosynthesis polyprenyl glycosylphosphotransferase
MLRVRWLGLGGDMDAREWSVSKAVPVDVGGAKRAPIPARAPVPPAAQRPRSHGSRTAKLAVVASDALAIIAAMVLAASIRAVISETPEALGPLWLIGAIALPVWLAVFARYRLYSGAAVASQAAEVSRVVHAVAAASVCTALLVTVTDADVSRAWLLLLFVTALVTVLVSRGVVRLMFRRARAHGRLKRRVVVVGTNGEALGVVHMLAMDSDLGYEVVGLVETGSNPDVVAPVPVLGELSDVFRIIDGLDVNGAIIATSAMDVGDANRLARDLMELGYHVEFTSGLVDIAAGRLIVRPLGRRPMMYIEPVRRFGWRAFAKRVFDVTVASIGLIFAAPVLLASALAIKLDSRGGVFFTQERVGKNGTTFMCMKLRTMVADAEQMRAQLQAQNDADGPLFKLRDDPRVTKVGGFLRRSSLDELPQLWNVLKGEMSIVGPRPAIPSEVSGWTEELRNRLRVRPGITGMWQVNGRSSASFDEYVRLDLYYVDNWTLLTDVGIVLKTLPTVLFRRGAY